MYCLAHKYDVAFIRECGRTSACQDEGLELKTLKLRLVNEHFVLGDETGGEATLRLKGATQVDPQCIQEDNDEKEKLLKKLEICWRHRVKTGSRC